MWERYRHGTCVTGLTIQCENIRYKVIRWVLGAVIVRLHWEHTKAMGLPIPLCSQNTGNWAYILYRRKTEGPLSGETELPPRKDLTNKEPVAFLITHRKVSQVKSHHLPCASF